MYSTYNIDNSLGQKYMLHFHSYPTYVT